MASNDEGQGSGDCDDVYRAADEFFSLTDDQQMLLLGPQLASGLRPTRRAVLRLRPALRFRPASRPALRPVLPRGAEPVYNRKQRGNGFLTNLGLLDWWSRRWTTTILSQRRPMKRARATTIK